jgi:hypothetical protein
VAHTVYLHVGTPKSGTTYLQAVLGANKQRLAAEAGLLFPGRGWADQVRATRDVVGANPHGDYDEATEGAWQRLVDEITAWDGAAVVSMEWLGSAGRKQVPRIVESLRPAKVEVIVTARDLARTIPAAWQEFVQNWNPWSWEEFIAAITAENPKATASGRVFWVQQDLSRILAVWRDVLPVEQLHVVTVPPRGAPAGELWKRFASVLGVDPFRFDATGGGTNESLGLESTELFLRLNRASRLDNMSWEVYREALKGTLAKRGLSRRKPSESAIVLPESAHTWVKACAADQVEAVRSSGVHVVGDLADLEPQLGMGGAQPDRVSDSAVLDAAVDGLVFLAENRTREIQRLRAANAELRREVSSQRRRLGVQRRKLDRPGVRTAPTERPMSPKTWTARLRRAARRGVRVMRGRR